jgi:hypothetical protein
MLVQFTFSCGAVPSLKFTTEAIIVHVGRASIFLVDRCLCHQSSFHSRLHLAIVFKICDHQNLASALGTNNRSATFSPDRMIVSVGSLFMEFYTILNYVLTDSHTNIRILVTPPKKKKKHTANRPGLHGVFGP